MEWAGIPAVAVLHEALAGSADAMLQLSGMSGYPYVKVLFPTPPSAIWSPEVCATVADAVVPEIIGRLMVADARPDGAAGAGEGR
jgi:hypothetical protein